MPKVKRIDHIAILVDDLDETLGFWQEALGLELGGALNVPEEQSMIAFLPAGESQVELVKPTSEDSGLARYLKKRGPGMHHICLEVDDIEGMIAQLKQNGIQMINEEPKTGAGGRRYAFIHPKSAHGVMVELYELPLEVNA